VAWDPEAKIRRLLEGAPDEYRALMLGTLRELSRLKIEGASHARITELLLDHNVRLQALVRLLGYNPIDDDVLVDEFSKGFFQ
jgi:hypothetical protein